MASEISNRPEPTSFQAPWKAVEPPAQAFSTFVIGGESSPAGRSATCPRMQCCQSLIPQPEFENHADCKSFFPIPASFSTPSSVHPVNSLIEFSKYFPNL